MVSTCWNFIFIGFIDFHYEQLLISCSLSVIITKNSKIKQWFSNSLNLSSSTFLLHFISRILVVDSSLMFHLIVVSCFLILSSLSYLKNGLDYLIQIKCSFDCCFYIYINHIKKTSIMLVLFWVLCKKQQWNSEMAEVSTIKK